MKALLRNLFGKRRENSDRDRRGFVLIVIVGMLVVLIVLGISFAEQGRVDLLGAQNSRDLSAIEGVAEIGFEFAKQALAHDPNVKSTLNAGWNSTRGAGFTSRWGFNPYSSTSTNSGGIVGPDPAPNRASPEGYLDAYQLLTWNEEDRGNNYANGYAFKFDPNDPKSRTTQRHPVDEREMMDVWQLQALQRVRNYRVRSGTNFGTVQIAISPRDGGINVNDMYDMGTVIESPGWYEKLAPGIEGGLSLAKTGSITRDGLTYSYDMDRASPDRRTMEYVLGKRPEFAQRNLELNPINPGIDGAPATSKPYTPGFVGTPGTAYTPPGPSQPEANTIFGNRTKDDGVYNFSRYFEPGGFAPAVDTIWTSDGHPTQPTYTSHNDVRTYHAYIGMGWLTKCPDYAPTIYYNASTSQPYRYNFEGARYPLWAMATGMSLRIDKGDLGHLWQAWYGYGGREYWYPTGRFSRDPHTYQPWMGLKFGNKLDRLFHGFGFDRMNPLRGGAEFPSGTSPDPWLSHNFPDDPSTVTYSGAGVYGHKDSRTFQNHFIEIAAMGRFWTDLMANWYFGGAPGYTGTLGSTAWYDDPMWTRLGSSYDSAGIGTNWMPPTAMVWSLGGFGSNPWVGASQVRPNPEGVRGMQRDPGNMLPAKPAATYLVPFNKWDDDHRNANAHFTYNDTRISIRACGIQENCGLFGANTNNGRMYDAINLNVTNAQVAYGLLTPEKIPSMLNRTTVAAHLHWKARLLDGAHKGMESYPRYNPNGTVPPRPYAPADAFPIGAVPAVQPNAFGRLTNPNLPYDPATNPVVPYNPDINADGNGDIDPDATHTGAGFVCKWIEPSYYKYSIHRHKDASNPGVRIWGKMDFSTPEPAVYYESDGATAIRNGSGQPADDVFIDCHYNMKLYEYPLNTSAGNQALSGNTMMSRPDNQRNWPDFFMQRSANIKIAKHSGVYMPTSNLTGGVYNYPITFAEGRVPPAAAAGDPDGPRTLPSPTAHSIHGLPNPDYMQLYPGTIPNYHWSDQFRRYFPLDYQNASDPGSPELFNKMADMDNNFAGGDMIHPENPVAKVQDATENGNAPFLPSINKDEAWRITRIGRKYQEIIADEMMDYQINPWWPNPCVHFTEVGTPLDKVAYKSEARCALDANGNIMGPIAAADLIALKWWSYYEHRGEGGIEYQIPDYYAYWNRFWCRVNTKYKRGGTLTTRERGEPYRFKIDTVNNLFMNPVENRGIYPQSYQYFGHYLVGLAPDDSKRWASRIADFPENTLEDQSGGEWRYVAAAIGFMLEPNSRRAPARNHPYRHWADFVAMLGHLVYRPPNMLTVDTDPNANPGGDGKRHSQCGVKAAVAKGIPATFFDGSRIQDADSLQAKIVARAGYWPISGNYGEYYDDTGGVPSLYPPRPIAGPWTTDTEWNRRIDEWRGRDAAGMRIEHHYISEAAANDVLVSLSNGKIKPIDFDGDGHVTMTRRSDIPNVDDYWKGYPWQDSANNAGAWTVEYDNPAGSNANYGTFNVPTNYMDFGIKKAGAFQAPGNTEIIQGCVTLPIKFRSNTFRVTVVAELTDATYKTIYSTKRYSRVYSRIPGDPMTEQNGSYTGEFIEHSRRAIYGADPENSWLGAK